MKAIDAANWFIDKANNEKLAENVSEGITNLKLQKILYFAQAAHLALNGKKPLFQDNIEAWDLGPVVPEVYKQFRDYVKQPIKSPSNKNYQKLNSDTVDFLENVWSIFGKLSAFKLVTMSHDHKPWQEAFSSNNKVITKQSMYDYYKPVFQKV